MRKELKRRSNRRLRLRATIQRFGQKPASEKRFASTVCLVNVETVDGVALADHVWMPGRKFSGVKPGTTVEFEAFVKPYRTQSKRDFKLDNPTSVRVVDDPIAC